MARRSPDHRSPSALWLAGLILAANSACVRENRARIDAADGDLVVLASVDPGGAINELAHYVPPSPAPRISRLGEETVLAYVIRRSALVGADGAIVSDELLAGLKVSMDPEAGCGRCLFETGVAPQIVHAGDRCALPAFVDPTVVGGASRPAFEIPGLRAKIFLEWPGDCACEPYALGGNYVLEDARVLELSPRIEPIEEVAQALNGEVTVISQHRVSVYAPDGSLRAERIGDALPFAGPVQSAIAGADGSVLIAAHDEDAGDAQTVLRRFSPALEQLGGELNLPVRPGTMRWVDGRALLLGQTQNRDDPRAMACVFPGADLGSCGPAAALSCGVFTPEGIYPATGGAYQDAALAGEKLVLGGTKGVVIFERAIDPTMSISAGNANGKLFGAVSDCRGTARWTAITPEVLRIDDTLQLSNVAALGDQLLLCISGASARVVTAPLAESIFDPQSPLPAFRTLIERGTACGPFYAVPECPGALRVQIGDDSAVLALDGDGEVVLRDDCTASAAAPSRETRTFVPGWTLSRTGGGRLFIRDDRAPSPAFVLLHGSERSEHPIAAVIAREDHFVAFQQTGELARVELTADRRDVASARWLDAKVELSPGERISSAVALENELGSGGGSGNGNEIGHGAEEYLAAVFGAAAPRFVRVSFPSPGAPPELNEFRIAEAPPLEGVVFRKITAVAPGTFVLPTSDGRIFLLRGDRLAEVERRPAGLIPARNAFECYEGTLPSLDPDADILRDASGAFGTAYVAGCEGTLYRVHPYSEPPVAIGLSLKDMSLYDEVRDGAPSLTAVRTECPDSALFAARGTGRTDWEQGRLFELLPGLSIRLEPTNRGARSSSLISSEQPGAIAGTKQWTAIAFAGSGSNGSIQAVGDAHRFWIQDPLGRADAHPLGAVLAGSTSGRLIFSRVSAAR